VKLIAVEITYPNADNSLILLNGLPKNFLEARTMRIPKSLDNIPRE
jgi:hypothetical protein